MLILMIKRNREDKLSLKYVWSISMEKGNNCGQKFPPAFGDTPDDFLIRFGRLIYTIIHRRCKGKQMVICSDGKYINVALEPENVLHGFIVYIAKNDYMVLHNYQGLNKAKPQTYLTGVLNWFLLAEVKKEAKRKNDRNK